MASVGQLDNVFRLLFGGAARNANFPPALQDDLLKLLSNADSLDTMADDIVAWRTAIANGTRNIVDEAGESFKITDDMIQFLARPQIAARLDAVPHVQKVALDFDNLYLSQADQIDVDALIQSVNKSIDDAGLTRLSDNDMLAIRKTFDESVETREATIKSIMDDHGVSRSEAIEGFSREMTARQRAAAGLGDDVPPANTVDDATTPKSEPETTTPKDEPETTAPKDEPETTTPKDEPETTRPRDGDTTTPRDGDATTGPKDIPRGPGALSRGLKFMWNNTAGIWVNPLASASYDFYRLGRNIITDYSRRLVSWQYTDYKFSKALFDRADARKTTNTAGLALDIKASRKTSTFDYKYTPEGTTKSPDDLYGAVEDVGDTLKKAQGEVEESIENISTSLKTASSEIQDAANQLEAARALTQQESALKATAASLNSISTNILSTTGSVNVDRLTRQLQSIIGRTADEATKDVLQKGFDDIDALRNSDGFDPEAMAGDIADIYTRMSTEISTRATEVNGAASVMTDRANDILRKHQTAIQSNVESSALGELNSAIENLDANVQRISGRIADIEAPPPQKAGDHLLGGTIVARLAAHEAKPLLANVSDYSDNLTRITGDIRQGLDTSALDDAFEAALNSGDGTRVENLRALSEALARKAETVEDISATGINNALTGFDEALESVDAMDLAVNKYTETTANVDIDIFGTNTGLARQLGAGLAETESTRAFRRQYTDLVKSGDIELPEGHTLDEILRWTPGENAFNSRAPKNSNTGVIQKTDDQKFLEYYFVSRDLDAAIAKAEQLLNSGDENRYWEAMKWASLSYARDAAKRAPTDVKRADPFFAEFITAMRDRSKGRVESGRRAGAFTDRIEHSTEKLFAEVSELGANKQREQWAWMWNRHRNLRFNGDYENELKYAGNDPEKMKERVIAHEWKTSWGATGRLGMNPFMRLGNAMPGAIWDYLPYRASHFDDAKMTRQTLLFGTIRWGSGAALLYAGYSWGDGLINGPEDTRPKVAENLSEALDYSEGNVERVQRKAVSLEQEYNQVLSNIDNDIARLTTELDAKIAGATGGQADQYRRIKEQMLETTSAYRAQFEDDLRVSQTGIQATLESVQQIDQFIRGTNNVEEANELLEQQQNFINKMDSTTEEVLAFRLAQSHEALEKIEAAIESGAVMTSAPLPTDIYTDIQPPNGWVVAPPDTRAIKQQSQQKLAEIQLFKESTANEYVIAAGMIDQFIIDQSAVLDQKIQEATTANNTEAVTKYEQIKTDMLETTRLFKEDLEKDRVSTMASIDTAITDMQQLDTQIQSTTNAATAQRLLAEQQQKGDAVAELALHTLTQRSEQFQAAVIQITTATDTATPSGTVTPGVIAAPSTTTTPGTTTPGTTTPGTTTPGTTTPTPAVDNRPQWQKDLDAPKAEAAQAYTKAITAINLIAGYTSSPTGDTPGALEILTSIDAQEKAIVDLQNEFRRDGEIQKANDLQPILDQVRIGEAGARDQYNRLEDLKNSMGALKDQATELRDQINQINTYADTGKMADLLRQLNSTTEQIEAKRVEAEQLFVSISDKAKENAELMNMNVDIKYRYGNAYQIDEGLKKLGGGEGGLPYQLFGRGESGVMSAAGGFLQTAWNGVKGIGEWWNETKRNARTQNERNWLNAIEAGTLIFGGMMAINFVNDKLFGGKMNGLVKWGLLAAIALHVINRTGKQNDMMVNAAQGRGQFSLQTNGNYNATARTTNRTSHVPTARTTTAGGTTTTSGATTAPGATTTTPSTVTAPIVDRNGQEVSKIIYVDGKMTVQDMSGGLPTTANDLVVDPEAAAQINAQIQAELNRIKDENGINPAMTGNGAHLPNPLKAEVDVTINDPSGKPLQMITIDYTITDPENVDLTAPKGQ